MSSRAFQFSQAPSIGTHIFPDLSTLPAVGDVVSAATVAAGKVTWRYNGPSGVGVFLPLTGGALSNYLSLHADPTSDQHAATKHYTDLIRSDTLGTAANTYVAKTGGDMTGMLTLPATTPTLPTHAVTKDYVDTQVSTAGTGTFLPLAGGTVAGALNVNGTSVFGASSVARVAILGGATAGLINASSGRHLQFSMGGVATKIIVSVAGVGNPLEITAGATAGTHLIDTTASLLKTKYQQVNSAYALSGAYSDATAPLSMVLGITGTPNAYAGGYPLMRWATTVDTATAHASGALRLIDIEHNWGGPNMTGGRQGVLIHMNQVAQTQNAVDGRDVFYQALSVSSDVSFNEGGTDVTRTAAMGHNFGFGAYARLLTGATNWYANAGCEWDILAQEGTSVFRQFGQTIVHLSGHAVQGALEDAALMITDGTGAVGWKTLFQVGSPLGQDPIGPGGAIMQWQCPIFPGTHAPQAGTGIDLSLGTISGAAFASRNFKVAGSGDVSIYQASIKQIADGAAIDVANYIVGYASINDGGAASADTTVGDWYQHAASGLIVNVTSKTAPGVVTGAAIQQVGYAAAAPGPVVVTNMNNDRGGNFTVNTTATLNAGLSLNPTGQRIGFNGAAPITKPTVTGARGGLLNTPVSSVGNGADLTEDLLQTFTLPANTLRNPGDRLRIVAGGVFAASTDSKTARVKVGGIVIANPTGTTAGITRWTVDIMIMMSSTSSHQYVAMSATSSNTLGTLAGNLTFAATGAVDITVTGQNATNPVAGSITCLFLSIESLPASGPTPGVVSALSSYGLITDSTTA